LINHLLISHHHAGGWQDLAGWGSVRLVAGLAGLHLACHVTRHQDEAKRGHVMGNTDGRAQRNAAGAVASTRVPAARGGVAQERISAKTNFIHDSQGFGHYR